MGVVGLAYFKIFLEKKIKVPNEKRTFFSSKRGLMKCCNIILTHRQSAVSSKIRGQKLTSCKLQHKFIYFVSFSRKPKERIKHIFCFLWAYETLAALVIFFEKTKNSFRFVRERNKINLCCNLQVVCFCPLIRGHRCLTKR